MRIGDRGAKFCKSQPGLSARVGTRLESWIRLRTSSHQTSSKTASAKHLRAWDSSANGKRNLARSCGAVWVEDDDQSLRRQQKRVEAVAAYEELDNSDGALTADQLAKRFKAEAGAQSEANRPLA